MVVSAKLQLLIVFLMIVSIGVSLALPARDVMDRVYDESEAVPYESVPVFASAVELVRDPVVLQNPLGLALHHFSRLLDDRGENRGEQSVGPLISDTLTIRDRCLRC